MYNDKCACKVKCDAHHCAYNDSEKNLCMADDIKVGSQNACCPSETLCHTFKMK